MADVLNHLIDVVFSFPLFLLVILWGLGRFLLKGILIASTPKTFTDMIGGNK